MQSTAVIAPLAMNLYMVRHGQTASSRENRFTGSSDPPLTAVGEAMALAFAQAYASMTWAAKVIGRHVDPKTGISKKVRPVTIDGAAAVRLIEKQIKEKRDR